MAKKLSLLLALFIFSSGARASFEGLHEGDIIFIQSTSSQSGALREITKSQWTHMGMIVAQGSSWYVLEAAQGVTITPLLSFIARSFAQQFSVRRVKESVMRIGASDILALKAEASKYLGLPYDLSFEWSDSSIYCSELVWKTYQRALRLEIGKVQVIGEFPLGGPEAIRLIQERYTNQGRNLNMEEPIISPVQMYSSPMLEEVLSNQGN